MPVNVHRYMGRRGFTLIEVLVSLAIFSLIIVSVAWLVIQSLRSSSIIWEQLATQHDGRAALQQFTDDVRRAEPSSVGDYPIEYASTTEFIFFANIDNDISRERVRFWLDGTDLKKGVIHPSGTPLGYTGDEEVVTIAEAVVNIEEGVPVFEYYDHTYPATTTPLSMPSNLSEIRLVRMQLELEKDPTETPVPRHMETVVHIRNLKDN